MGAAIEVNTSELEKLAQKMNSFMLSGGDTSRLLGSLGGVLGEQTEERFDIGRDPKGDPWHELTEAYKRRKREGDKNHSASTGGTLVREGFMLQSLEHQVKGSDSLLFGSPMEYAVHHQSPFSDKRRREFLGLSTDNIDELQDKVIRFMERHLS